MRKKDREQLARILRAEADVRAAEAGYPAGGSHEAAMKIARAAAVRDRAMDNAKDRVVRKAIRAITPRGV